MVAKYAARGYEVVEDCTRFHRGEQVSCSVCSPTSRRWGVDCMALRFDGGTTVDQPGPPITWRLGRHITEVKTRGGVTVYIDRGTQVLVDEGGEGDAHLYDGLHKHTQKLASSKVPSYFRI